MNKKGQPKIPKFGFNLSAQQLMQHPYFFVFFLASFYKDNGDDQDSYSIPFSVQSFYSGCQRFVEKTCQLLFKRFMQQNCRLSLMDINFYWMGMVGNRLGNTELLWHI